MSLSRNHGVYNSYIRGGMRPREAEELSDLDESTLEEGEYSPSDIPAIGEQVAGYNETNYSLPAEDIDEYVDKLLQSPGEIVPEWSLGNGDYPFENLATTIREKRDEYTLRTVYAFEDMLEQYKIDEAVGTIVSREDYRHETANNSADGHLGLLLGQYINEINEIVEEEDSILSEAYRVIDETNEATSNGRQVLQKGMTYRVSHPSIKEMQTDRINEDQERYSNWEIAEPEVLEVRPLRFARSPENGSIYGFRDKIDRQRQELEEDLEEIL